MRTSRWLPAVVVLVGGLLTGCAAGANPMMAPQPGPVAGAGAHRMMGHAAGHGPIGMMGSPGQGWRAGGRFTCQPPADLPGTVVHVMVGDMGDRHSGGLMGRQHRGWPMMGAAMMGAHMMLHAFPATVPAGQVSFVVANMGTRTHEMVVLPLARGQQVGDRAVGADRRVDEAGSLGEASASCAAGEGEGIEPRAVGWVTLDLAPGRYEVVCNLPGHYAAGMRQRLTAP